MLIDMPLLLSMAVGQVLTCLATAGDAAGHHILAVQQAGRLLISVLPASGMGRLLLQFSGRVLAVAD